MLFSLRSIVLFSASMAASCSSCGTAAVPVPSDRDDPVVTPALCSLRNDCAAPHRRYRVRSLRPTSLQRHYCRRMRRPRSAPEMAGEIRIALTAITVIAGIRIIEISLYASTAARRTCSWNYRFTIIEPSTNPVRELTPRAQTDRV